MEAILGFFAEIALLGSIALLGWGAVLTLGQVFRSERKREATREAAERGEHPHGAWHA